MFMEMTSALAREHIADLHARAARNNLAREARRACAEIGHRGSRLTRSVAATVAGAPCRPATVTAC